MLKYSFEVVLGEACLTLNKFLVVNLNSALNILVDLNLLWLYSLLPCLLFPQY